MSRKLALLTFIFLTSTFILPTPARLIDFLESGLPPVYVGFVSLAHRDPARTTALVRAALQRAGQCGVLMTCRGGLADAGPSGELGVYLENDGGPRPHRVHYRAPSFVHLQALPLLLRGRLIAELVAIIGRIDIVFRDADR